MQAKDQFPDISADIQNAMKALGRIRAMQNAGNSPAAIARSLNERENASPDETGRPWELDDVREVVETFHPAH